MLSLSPCFNDAGSKNAKKEGSERKAGESSTESTKNGGNESTLGPMIASHGKIRTRKMVRSWKVWPASLASSKGSWTSLSRNSSAPFALDHTRTIFMIVDVYSCPSAPTGL